MTPLVFILVLISATLHATWNFLARKLTGNEIAVWLANWCTVLFLFPLCFFFETPLTGQEVTGKAWLCLFITGVIHIFYYRLLVKAYAQGEVSVVYPISRGSAVASLALILTLFLGEKLSVLGAVAIVIILAGILSLAIPALKEGKANLKLPLLVGGIIVSYSLCDAIGAKLMHPVFYLWGMMLFLTFGQIPLLMKKYKGQFKEIFTRYKKEILLIGFADPAAYLIILFCYTMGAASYIIALREFSVVIASILAYFLLKEKLTRAKIIAINLIALGMALMKLS